MIRKLLVGYSFFVLPFGMNTSLNSAQPITELQQQLQSLQQQLQQLDSSLQTISRAPTEDINILFQEKIKEIEKDFATAQEYGSKSFKPKVKEFFDFKWKPDLTEQETQRAETLANNLTYYFYMITHLRALLFSIGGMGDYFTKNNINQQNKTRYTELLNKIESLAGQTDTYLKGFKDKFQVITPALSTFDPELPLSISQYFNEIEELFISTTDSKTVILEALKGNITPLEGQYQKTAESFQ